MTELELKALSQVLKLLDEAGSSLYEITVLLDNADRTLEADERARYLAKAIAVAKQGTVATLLSEAKSWLRLVIAAPR